jgi:hypothetical protein
MNDKSLLRLLVVTQIFVLFAIVALPTLIHYLQQPIGRLVYGLLAILCILLALLLRRKLSELDW